MTKTVWHVSSNPWNSAITEYALSASLGMKACGWNVAFSCLSDSLAERRANGLDILGPVFRSFGLRELVGFRRAFDRLRPDVVCLYGGKENFLASFLPKKARIVRLRGADRDMTHAKPPFSYRLSEGPLSAVLTPCEALFERYKLPSGHPVFMVPIGISEDRFFFSSRSYKQVQGERPTVRIIGRFDPIKGHREFFSIYGRMLRSWKYEAPLPLLEIVGNPVGVSAKGLRESAEKEGLVFEKDFRVIPWRVRNLADLMSRTHLGLIPSLGSEVICRVAQEFLLCGTPIVVSGVGALEETLFGTLAGASYRNLDHRKAEELIGSWIDKAWKEGPEIRRERSEHAAKVFSLSKMGGALDQIFSKLL